ncbi:MAG: helix-turn-helix domain-containing protein, partial [Deltaproteobacteria bacterium]|nr:helix-turn-helix domain-containing protein [Deltaproteobacteria bacterium]
LSLMEVPKRVAYFLLFSNLKQTCSKGAIAKLTISQRELSKILGTTPETISRVLKKLTGENIIRVTGRNIRILDCEALEELATG